MQYLFMYITLELVPGTNCYCTMKVIKVSCSRKQWEPLMGLELNLADIHQTG